MDFDEWWKEESLNTFDYPSEAAEAAFNAGQQSKQAEIDALQKRINEAMELLEYNEYTDSHLQALEALKGEQK